MLTERSNIPSPISATSLAACMKVDSMFCSNLVPKLSIAASVNIMQFTVYNHMENMQNGEDLFRFGFMPCHAISYHTIPYHPYHTIPYHSKLYHMIAYHSHYTIPYHVMPCHTILYHTIPYHTIPFQTIPYDSIP